MLTATKSLPSGQLNLTLEMANDASADSFRAARPSAVFRPIHYLGSKLRLVDLIRSTINTLDPSMGAVCDLFSGSGTVSAALSHERDVVSVDIQEYSRVLCSALLKRPLIENAFIEQLLDCSSSGAHAKRLRQALEPVIQYEESCIDQATSGMPEPLCDLLEHGCLLALEKGANEPGIKPLRRSLEEVLRRLKQTGLAGHRSAMMTRHFGGAYFSYSQAVELDILLEGIEGLEKSVQDFFRAALLSTASDIVNTVGRQFAQPIRPRSKDGAPKRHLIKKIREDRARKVFPEYKIWLSKYQSIELSKHVHRVIRGDYLDVLTQLETGISVVYADPPYTRDHYSRFYHVLETMCLRDEVPVSTIRVNGERKFSRGIYREDRHQSPFCIKSQAPTAFSALFQQVGKKGIPLLLSYSPFAEGSRERPRLLPMNELEGLARKSFRSVETVTAGQIAHSKLNATHMNVDVAGDAEVFLICQP